MSLTDHARAFRALADALHAEAMDCKNNVASTEGQVLLRMGRAHNVAAAQLEQIVCDEAQTLSEGHACTVNHKTLPGPKCPACGAPRG